MGHCAQVGSHPLTHSGGRTSRTREICQTPGGARAYSPGGEGGGYWLDGRGGGHRDLGGGGVGVSTILTITTFSNIKHNLTYPDLANSNLTHSSLA